MCVGYMYTVEWRLKSHISPQYPSSDNVVKVLPWTPKKSLKKRGICFNSFPKLFRKKSENKIKSLKKKKKFVSIVYLNCSEKKSENWILFVKLCGEPMKVLINEDYVD